ncbi:hypothetical protein K438DRAFT_1782497 [Mycena galopus ATCC 62051]|nr:hypothetical protein K438DRAFT_1782497 [Mycena galopus ATCC 62051]
MNSHRAPMHILLASFALFASIGGGSRSFSNLSGKEEPQPDADRERSWSGSWQQRCRPRGVKQSRLEADKVKFAQSLFEKPIEVSLVFSRRFREKAAFLGALKVKSQ